jgi:hypothetical protein
MEYGEYLNIQGEEYSIYSVCKPTTIAIATTTTGVRDGHARAAVVVVADFDDDRDGDET